MAKNFLRKSVLALVLLSAATAAFAQRRTVKGVVTDDSGPLVGVTVVLRDPPPTGAATGLDGSYALAVPDDNAVLVFSYVGYRTVEVKVGKQSVIDVTMQPDATALDEVVVVGYGTQMKSHLTGAISKVGGDALVDRPVSDIATALQGQISGLNINNVTSEVGVAPSIRVRGTGSISADSAPLVIIDGYPVPGGLSDLNPSDVKSIEILKDAASAAIYGSRAANGVIMVTTKSGTADKAKYSIKVAQGLKWAYQLHDLMTSSEHLQLLQWQESLGAVGQNFVPASNYRAAAWIERNIGSTDWQREALRDLAGITNVQFSLTGGKKTFRYYASGAYTKDQGIMLQNEVQKVNFRSKMDVDLSKAVKFGINLAGTYQQASRPKNNFIDFYRTPSFMPVRHNAWTTALTGYEGFARGSHFNAISVPTAPTDDENARWENANPFSSANNNPRSVMANTQRWNESFSGLGNIYLTVDICKGLTFRTSNGFNIKYSPSYYYAKKNATKDGEASNATFFSTLYVDLLTENTFDFHRTWGRHDFEALAGYTAETTRVQRVALTGTGFPTDDIKTLNAATVFNLASSNNGNGAGTGTFRYPDVVFQSFLARVNYAYDNRYLLSASIRLDSSSLFAGGHRNAWFPSVSLGWRISEEQFLKGLHGLSNLKLRASYGVTGNNNIDYNAALEVYEAQNYVLGEGTGSLQPGVASAAVLANRDITWEQTDEFNFGLDAGFLDNRINLSVDGYYSVTRALLFKQPMQSFSGYTNYWNNIGRVRNSGVEIQIDTYNFDRRRFKWDTSINFSLSRNKLLELGGEKQVITQGERTENYLARVGEPLIQYYGFKAIGVWNSQEEIDANPHFSTDAPGGLRIWDANGDNQLDDNDRVVLGTPYPSFTYGMTNTFRIGDFDLSFMIQGVQGVTLFNGDLYYTETMRYNKAYVKDRWISAQHPGDGRTPYEKLGTDMLLTDYGLQDGSYVCLRNVTLGYTFPKRIVRKLHLSGLRLYASGNNLFYIWSSDYKGINPEARMTSGNYSSPMIAGYQRGGFPLTSTVTFGLDLTF